MNFNDEQNNANDKHADDPVQSGQSEQNTIRILKPGSNNDLIDQLSGGPLDKTSVNYEYHSPDPTETAQRLALINYLSAGEEKMVPFNPVNLLQIMSSHKMETEDVALIAGTDSVAVESGSRMGSPVRQHCTTSHVRSGYRRNGFGALSPVRMKPLRQTVKA